MTILDTIIARKREEVRDQKKLISQKLIEQKPMFKRTVISMANRIAAFGSTGIIAEFKRRSPSKSDINIQARVADVVPGYELAEVAGISVLTDTDFFAGKLSDVVEARGLVQTPILRKDFTIDTYQIAEAKAAGADVVLLLANVLSKSELENFADFASSIGLETLLEIREKEEVFGLDLSKFSMIGINNRNLKTFEVDIEHSISLAKFLPANMIKIAESGISNPNTINRLKQHGFNGFLIGETFMKEKEPGKACKEFIRQIAI